MEGDIEPAEAPAEPQGGEPQEQPAQLAPGQLSRGEALERLDEVEEGSPRVVIQGDESEDQDW